MSTINSVKGGGASEYVRNQYSKRFSELITVNTITEALDAIFDFSYVAPIVSLFATPGSALHEFGTSINAISFSAIYQKTSNPLTTLELYRGASVVDSETPSPTGGTYVHNELTPVDDTTSFTVKVGDGTAVTTSNIITYTFVYPFYWGVGDVGLTAGQIQTLTKSVTAKDDKSFASSPINQVYYFAYPAIYGSLTSILDTNGFETFYDYKKTVVSFHMLDGTNQSYFVYEFNNLTTQTDFTNTFIF
jgi:hypothetical protein